MHCDEGQCEMNGLLLVVRAKDAENKRLRGEVERLKTELEFTELRLNAALNGDMDFARQGFTQVTG